MGELSHKAVVEVSSHQLIMLEVRDSQTTITSVKSKRGRRKKLKRHRLKHKLKDRPSLTLSNVRESRERHRHGLTMNANRKRSNAVRWIDSSNKSSSSSAKTRKIGLIEQRWMQSIKDSERNRMHSVV